MTTTDDSQKNSAKPLEVLRQNSERIEELNQELKTLESPGGISFPETKAESKELLPCPKCHGTGKRYTVFACKSCNGKGLIERVK